MLFRSCIERLLEADDQTAGILERGPDAGPTDAPGEGGPPLLPERVFAGRFKLRQKLGEGGMGEVWVADQAEPVQRRVAIKVVRPGLDSERMLARFDQQRASTVRKSIPRLISSSATCRRTGEAARQKNRPHAPLADRLANLETIADDRIDRAVTAIVRSAGGEAGLWRWPRCREEASRAPSRASVASRLPPSGRSKAPGS